MYKGSKPKPNEDSSFSITACPRATLQRQQGAHEAEKTSHPTHAAPRVPPAAPTTGTHHLRCCPDAPAAPAAQRAVGYGPGGARSGG